MEQRGWDYPVSVARIEQACALENVAVDEDGHMMMVAELLAEVDVGRFESRDHLVSTLEPVCEDIRAERRRGLVQRLRETFLGS